jgi:hypothetical protein
MDFNDRHDAKFLEKLDNKYVALQRYLGGHWGAIKTYRSDSVVRTLFL